MIAVWPMEHRTTWAKLFWDNPHAGAEAPGKSSWSPILIRGVSARFWCARAFRIIPCHPLAYNHKLAEVCSIGFSWSALFQHFVCVIYFELILAVLVHLKNTYQNSVSLKYIYTKSLHRRSKTPLVRDPSPIELVVTSLHCTW